MPTTVVNRKTSKGTVDIGRPGPYGNPFPEYKYGRKACIVMFKQWLLEGMHDRVEPLATEERRQYILENMERDLKDQILECYCKPESCHGDIYVELLEGGG